MINRTLSFVLCLCSGLVAATSAHANTPVVVYGDSLASSGLAPALRAALPGVTVTDMSVPGSFMLRSTDSWQQALARVPGRDLIIWQGINDLNSPGIQAGAVIAELGARVAAAYNAGARTVVALPYPAVRPYGSRPRDPADAAAANAQLPSLALSSGAILPLPVLPGAVGPDGLHLRLETYPLVARAIRAVGVGAPRAAPSNAFRSVPPPAPGQVFSPIIEQGPAAAIETIGLRRKDGTDHLLWYQPSTGDLWLVVQDVDKPDCILFGSFVPWANLIAIDMDDDQNDDILAHVPSTGLVARYYMRDLGHCGR